MRFLDRIVDWWLQRCRHDPVHHATLRARADILKAAIEKIARQSITSEVEDGGDYEDAYDQCVLTARSAICDVYWATHEED